MGSHWLISQMGGSSEGGCLILRLSHVERCWSEDTLLPRFMSCVLLLYPGAETGLTQAERLLALYDGQWGGSIEPMFGSAGQFTTGGRGAFAAEECPCPPSDNTALPQKASGLQLPQPGVEADVRAALAGAAVSLLAVGFPHPPSGAGRLTVNWEDGECNPARATSSVLCASAPSTALCVGALPLPLTPRVCAACKGLHPLSPAQASHDAAGPQACYDTLLHINDCRTRLMRRADIVNSKTIT